MRAVLLLLGELSDSDIDWILASSQCEQIAPGDVLIREGEKVDALYVVLTGKLTVSISQASDDPLLRVYTALEGEVPQRELAKLSGGEMVGEMAFMDTRPHATTIQALEDSVVLSIPRSILLAKLQQDSGFAIRFYRALAAILTDKLRSTFSRFRYSNGQPLDNQKEYEDELDPIVMEHLALAGARFDWLLQNVNHADQF
ncbi:MAG: cyclic nucleotide-binding domain-containing protein [Elainella sp. C42_A2020_010]|nr:cyclic nucleotide-binding domain-containing protein [Elainella sp. C42_A2020_010]